jgi:hypothetical protein
VEWTRSLVREQLEAMAGKRVATAA